MLELRDLSDILNHYRQIASEVNKIYMKALCKM